MLERIAAHWGNEKLAIEAWIGLSADALHVHVGVALLLIVALVTRKRLNNWTPWLGVLMIECCNEFIDMNQAYGSVEANWPASRHDILNTMFLPTLILIYAKLRIFEKQLRSTPKGAPLTE